jgi:hypothetical protein
MAVPRALLAVLLLTAGPSAAESLQAEAARSFISGKLFSFSCFERSHGTGRIFSDGSVDGDIYFRGAPEMRHVTLPAGTLGVRGQTYCATLPGLPLEPCFSVDRTGPRAFRGSLIALQSASCEFIQRADTPVEPGSSAPLPSTPIQLHPPLVTQQRTSFERTVARP